MTTTQNRRPKFSIQQNIMDFTSKIRHIMGSVVCNKHDARVEEPCWWIHTDGLEARPAVCGSRASQMYTGKVSAISERRSGPPPSKNTNRNPKKENNR